jgi:hypothetical protein
MPVSEEMKLVRRCFTTICIMKEIIKVNLFKEICIQGDCGSCADIFTSDRTPQ